MEKNSEIHKIDVNRPKNTWICETEKIIISSPVMEIVERNCKSSEDERKFKFFLFRSRDWCNIIPVTEAGNIVLVKQFRIGVNEQTIEIPGGVTDSTDIHNQSAAIRELEEETGYAPLPGAKCFPLGWTYPNPAIQDNRCHSFVLGPVRKKGGQNLDPGEMIEVLEVPISDIPSLILRGEIKHALMLNAFFFLSLRSSETSAALLKELERFVRT